MAATSFQTIFAVPLTCDSCVQSVSKAVLAVDGVNTVDAKLDDQLVVVDGTAPPSAIAKAIQGTGKDAICRGSGNPNSSAVCILETHCPGVKNTHRGLIRLVQVAPTLTLVDITLNGLETGTYHVTVRKSGDISRGAVSAGGTWESESGSGSGSESESESQGESSPSSPQSCRGYFGTIQVDEKGYGHAFLSQPVAVWELIGRAMVVAASSSTRDEPFEADDANTVVGVVARSAGVWENVKTICSCTGKTVWREREEHVAKGVL